MKNSLACLLLLSAWACVGQESPPSTHAVASIPEDYVRAGIDALQWTHRFVSLGPRPSGSQAIEHQRRMIVETLGDLDCVVEEDVFVATTPLGEIPMANIVARFGDPAAERVVVISGHYDTLRQDGFVGANDGGSSAGLLMTLAKRLSGKGQAVWVIWFDGEEATVRWRGTDNTYGSRRVAERWAEDGTASRIAGLINVDMIGDRDLQLVYEQNSDAVLRDAVWALAAQLGYGVHFPQASGYIEDDHLPFMRAGIPSLDLIDFEYGAGNEYWHTNADQIDKLDGLSFSIALHVVEEAIAELLTPR